MKISLLQTNTVWQDIPSNIYNINQQVAKIDPGTDLVILPEMFNTGFLMTPELINPQEIQDTIGRIKEWSALTRAVFTGSLIRKKGDDYYNSFFWVTPNEDVAYYDKRHLFHLAGEGDHYKAGTERVTFSHKEVTFMPQVCYDLRFPVFSRNDKDYDCLIYVANWPHPRIKAWRTLLQARAIENQCYVVGVNRVGTDANGNEYSGQSMVVDYAGEIILDAGDKEFIGNCRLDCKAMYTFREKLPFLKDRDSFTLHL